MGRLPSLLLIFVGGLFSLSESVQLSEVFSSAPQEDPYYVKDGSTGPTLACSLKAPYSDRTKYEVLWTRYHKGQIRHISRNDKLHEKEHFELLSDATTGAYDLKIKSVSRTHVEGSYQCSLLDPNTGDQYSTEPGVVIALVPPGEPVVTEAPSESVTEGETVNIKCVSQGGSPQPSFTWSFPNGSVADDKYTNTIGRDGETESTLHFRVRPDDNGAFVTCAVTNKAIEGELPKEAKSARLNVLFKPRVHVLPVQDLTVEAGQAVQIVCETESNPSPPSYEWKHLSSGERYAAAKWPLIADRKMSGEFECRAWNTVGGGNEVLNLNVQYAPEIIVKERVNPNEGERVEVECLVEANPKAVEVRWAGPDGFLSEGNLLVLKSVTREQSGNYTCSATNYLTIYGQTGSQTRTGAGTTFVDVKRRPGKAVISPSRLSVIVGDVIDLICSAPDPGSPEAQFKWASPSSGGQFGTKEHDRANLLVRDSQLADNGRYRCRPHNRLGEGEEAVVDVTVIEPAKISRPLATERIYSAGESASGLECEAQGYPVPNIQWLRDGQPIDSKRYKMESTIVKSSCSERDFCSQTVTGSLLFTRPVQWADKGNYTCVANNGAGERAPDARSWTVVRVVHGPVVLNQKFPTESLAAAEVGTTAYIRCIVSARPRPTFSWMFNSEQIEETGRYSFQVNTLSDRPDEYEHVLQISDTTASDYGGYLCRATNGKGDKAEVIVQLKETGIPQKPSSLQKVGSTPVSLLVSWRPGFDGGYDQSFVVEYTSMNPFTENAGNEDVATLEVRNATRLEEIKADGSPSYLMTYNITGLKPLSTYYFRVRSANKKGVSEFTSNNIGTTNDVSEDSNMVAPTTLRFDIMRKSIEVEPRTPVDGCTLLYVSSGDMYRASGCFPADQAITDLPGGTFYKARFCSRSNMLRCSQMSPALESTHMAAGWRLYMLVPIAGLAFVVVLIVALLVICCRTRSPKKLVKKGPATISAMPQLEAKNAIVHGSQADSGVFTLDSARLKANQQTHTYSSSSEETAVETWSPEQYDVSHDPYLNEPNMHIFQGVMEDQMDQRSLSEPDEDDGRRIMREIIV